ncbi:MAG TPA: CDP-diacylglycerol--serine O-phosphatidyltransferase [Algoriphagus sp.]|uniref:CDP-diacylglycerol--serine O-phosphatidyltransferase n=1 Tax=unclassified Algoriphagus TaxID=2641541 RepID=UPI000C68215A|nr:MULTISPECIES: CDP-diacylglycerol--serine O-phosphatidyltransferase [unclassified Algoriphagus]MAL13018.1 CDP-diacylglycerol--serine O-phosphatidyltransferase [Algoriphagus sp.]MAN85787.1 CDP-diacylglycerol--serine O-phosphatidyltransferase [Algoriphagus sp.]QYH39374.1 CDP-diacylglycerol--serine O-phosphatidyltransferase [Algoriphagus sp. NBT04N3]HAD52085.1 CDP-diacylglycerol--serine O-phosphatidyltransferase [Algoriphagus sp.]HAH38177.1 CDP-diacylglycerol--serine O-phosphatidyltransferase [
MKFLKHIPNGLTLMNLLSGVIGISFVLNGNVLSGAYFIVLSAVFDFFDGFAARLLKVSGELGKQLDSLADCVSFGVLPGFILFQLTSEATNNTYLPYLTLIVPLMSAMRLAKFNIDTRQSDRFIGLPTPANALFISTLPYLAKKWFLIENSLSNPWTLIIIAWVFSILLVSEIPLIALKFKNFSLSDNVFRFVLIGLGIICIAWLGLGGIPIIILAYLGLSLAENALKT